MYQISNRIGNIEWNLVLLEIDRVREMNRKKRTQSKRPCPDFEYQYLPDMENTPPNSCWD